MTVADPTMRLERSLHKEGVAWVIGCDEVGRGAIAGPVAVGLSMIDAGVKRHPTGLRDSKMLSEPRREALAPLAREWSVYAAVGLASAEEVDRLGIMACLGLAGTRALEQLYDAGAPVADAVVILDGSHDWLTAHGHGVPRVRTQVKADRDCASVAAASVIAKVHRDRIMIDADEEIPGYGWKGNKGYASTEHYAAINQLGPSALHRHSWLHKADPALFELE
ncbi:ribonuclease HII [Leifsonia sp. H3M29-4]|uniref:ribonuclease HII n=1 Tax=Salinibacterium metalliresistens TaxID=3031321 RepID=UPI0023D99143|nr:ribonuclease HII [Salinibacterium metalliresistens]MDF1478721.1 ribonuclease HII [Salinibacterium metalliresistens]